MTDRAAYVRAALAASDASDAGSTQSRAGVFRAPMLVADGPLAGCILKSYRSGRDPEVLEPLVRRHASYIECLNRAGLQVPDTELLLMHEHGVLQPVVVQTAVAETDFVSHRLTTVPLATALRLLDLVVQSIGTFWSGVAQRPERIGLRTAPEFFASSEDGQVQFLETFPPLIGYSREDLGAVLLRFSESGLMRGLGALLPGRVREIQDPWYSFAGNLETLIEGAMRIRPDDRAALLEWAKVVAHDCLSEEDGDALLARLSRPRPRVSTSTTTRRFAAGFRPNA